jgi:hypothetical protein
MKFSVGSSISRFVRSYQKLSEQADKLCPQHILEVTVSEVRKTLTEIKGDYK